MVGMGEMEGTEAAMVVIEEEISKHIWFGMDARFAMMRRGERKALDDRWTFTLVSLCMRGFPTAILLYTTNSDFLIMCLSQAIETAPQAKAELPTSQISWVISLSQKRCTLLRVHIPVSRKVQLHGRSDPV